MENKDKAIGLFRYIMELYAQKYQVVNDINSQIWVKYISDIPDDNENIIFNYMDRTTDELESDLDNITLLQVQKPEFEKSPELPPILIGWIRSDCTKWNKPIEKIEKRPLLDNSISIIREEQTQLSLEPTENMEYFDDDKQRVAQYILFEETYNIWAERQNKINKTRKFFNELYAKYIDLDRDSETIELIIGQGILSCAINENQNAYHPILFKKVSMQFDVAKNIISIVDIDSTPDIYTMLLQSIDFINHSSIQIIKEQLINELYHPLDRNDTPDFLSYIANILNSESDYIDNPNDINNIDRSDTKLLIINKPVFFIRKRTGGVIKSIEEIISELEEKSEIPLPLLNLISENSPPLDNTFENSDINTDISTINKEDKDILLSKEANREQLEIAKRIEHYNAVLVQGPPGTGKTHTIANLMGHFLAQGKNILVTSHTKKALSVVKEKVVPELQNLCVSVLDDNSKDMITSIDGITEYISSNSSFALLNDVEKLRHERNLVIDNLNDIRKNIFMLKNKEFEPIVFGGESFSCAQAAKFVYDNKDTLAYIPGKIELGKPLPVTTSDLALLYKTNDIVSEANEKELNTSLPNPQHLLTSNQFSELIENENNIINENNKLATGLKIEINHSNKKIYFEDKLLCSKFDKEQFNDLNTFLNEANPKLSELETWCKHAILDGKKGGGEKSAWQMLINKIEETYNYRSDNFTLLLGTSISGELSKTSETINLLNEIKEYISKGKKMSSFSLFKPKNSAVLYKNININNNPISTVNDCDILIATCQIQIKREEISRLWKGLIEKHDGISFESLGAEPEQVAITYTSKINQYISWYDDNYAKAIVKMNNATLNTNILTEKQDDIFQIDKIECFMNLIYCVLPKCIQIAINFYDKLSAINDKINKTTAILSSATLNESYICKNLYCAIELKDITLYKQYYEELSILYDKYYYVNERERILSDIRIYAPEWAELIKNRIGVFGNNTFPDNIVDAWKWKQFSGIIDKITAMPFDELQQKSIILNNQLREVTAKLAEKSAWYHLLSRTEKDISQKQALQGWKLTVKKIGKGTGKNAPRLKKEAQLLMAKCQLAVPAWIMPINKALESLDPKTNKFDIVIIDEASQSDISALAIIYLAKKVIIVGDDEQVSPSAVGIDVDKMTNLSDMYIKNVIANSHLYDMKSSLYDIAKTTFPTLMLKEHFRCVPDIIGYSNRLSYDYKIKPLRDDSSVVTKPATISYRVNDGIRHSSKKINEKEAKMIIALMLACMEFEEYKDMTFGAISLLGDDQAKYIQKLAMDKITPLDYEKRHILCGNASQFQGDERDIIFISLVDNNSGNSPLRLTSEGIGKSTKQRYNVAVSRAKNQLWVVHSLDISKDLKSGDMRRDLIEYVMNPSNFSEQLKEVKAKADSPFEVAVVNALKLHGYQIVQQWKVGSYRIDMVAIFGDKKIAIECDGELYHSGDDKIREDMERQSILERLGWRFIRIRGSEYYRNPENTIKRVIEELTNYGIEPHTDTYENNHSSYLKNNVIIRAEKILYDWENEPKTEYNSLD